MVVGSRSHRSAGPHGRLLGDPETARRGGGGSFRCSRLGGLWRCGFGLGSRLSGWRERVSGKVLREGKVEGRGVYAVVFGAGGEDVAADGVVAGGCG